MILDCSPTPSLIGAYMTRTETAQAQVRQLVRAHPFRPFAISMENGDRLLIEHPENIAFDPGSSNGKPAHGDFYVISGALRVFSNFGAVTSVAVVDRGEV